MNPLLSFLAESCCEIVERDNAPLREANLRFERETLALLRDMLGETDRLDEVLRGIYTLVGEVEFSAYLRGIRDSVALLHFDGSRSDIPGI